MNNHEINKKGYFNSFEFEKIRDVSKKNPYEAIRLYENYFNRYPDDHFAYTYYVSMLITVGNYEKAEEVLKQVKYRLDRESIYKRNDKRARFLYYNLAFCKLKLLIYQHRYEDALSLYYKTEDLLSLGEQIELYLLKLNGKLDKKRVESDPYINRQIIEYREEDFIDHIKKHLQDYNENNKSISKTYFSYDFPMDKVLKEIKSKLKDCSKLSWGFHEDTYVFKYDGCGRDNDKLVDYFKVICFYGTEDMITITPSSGCEEMPYMDLNYLNEKEEVKVKKISQIDKFNRRYKRD